ncbi:MAG: TetR/AcrR family transcriptional regulator [Actinomycetaceae bacterium]|nr:TetR/AcrR family transcriptional regulator [Actinomycetaceae bacterium]
MDEKRERGPYASGLARREAILDVTVDLLAEVGYHGMSLRDVARRVGISHPGVIYHFPNKEALLMAVVEHYEDDAGLNAALSNKMEPLAVLDSFIEMTEKLYDTPVIVEMECMLVVEASSPLHPAHEHFNTRNERLVQILTRAWTRLQLEGKLRADEDAIHQANATIALWHGLKTVWLYDRSLDIPAALAKSLLAHFTPEFMPDMVDHYHDCGWIR